MPIKSSIKPIIGPSIRWSIFLKDTTDLTAHSITTSIDKSGLVLSDYAKFLVALSELHVGKQLNPIEVLKNNATILEHLHFSFLVTDKSILILKINEATKLSILSTKIDGGRVALISGTLGEWKTAIVTLSAIEELSELSFKLLTFFKQLGLGYVFADYTYKNGTSLLEYKAS